MQFFDHQRNAGVKYSRTISPRLLSETSLGYIRSTPFFPAINHTQPGLTFGDGLFQGFNSAAGSIFGSYGNLYQFRHDMSYVHASHAFKWGVEIRFNRDATIFGTNTNGFTLLEKISPVADTSARNAASTRRSAAGFMTGLLDTPIRTA